MKILLSLLVLSIALDSGPTFGAEQDKSKKAWPAKISREQAKEASLKLVPGELICWDLQIENGIPEYAYYIKSKDGRISEVELNGNTGKKENIGILIDSKSSDGREIKTTNLADRARLKDAKFTIEQSQEKALKEYPGTVEAWEILVWGGGDMLVHDFRIVGKSGKRVVTVNAKTGKIMSVSKFVDGQGR